MLLLELDLGDAMAARCSDGCDCGVVVPFVNTFVRFEEDAVDRTGEGVDWALMVDWLDDATAP
mgnify:CR=1 FL=1